MNNDLDNQMQRRKFLKTTSIALLGLSAIGTTGLYLWLNSKPSEQDLTLDVALRHLQSLKIALKNQRLTSEGQWQLNQIFEHCAQSIEYSISGYPLHKSDIFKTTVGALAFSVFARNGSMTHNLAEAIPGAPALDIGTNDTQAGLISLQRLMTALENFSQYQGKLAPHFAYGELSKVEYELAHVMHLRNHFQELHIIAANS